MTQRTVNMHILVVQSSLPMGYGKWVWIANQILDHISILNVSHLRAYSSSVTLFMPPPPLSSNVEKKGEKNFVLRNGLYIKSQTTKPLNGS